MRTQVIAHRGSSAAHAENSWAAFEAAVADGGDAIECDVQGTRDDVLVIRHDLAVGNRLVAEATAAEIEGMEPDLVRLADLLAWAPRAKIPVLGSPFPAAASAARRGGDDAASKSRSRRHALARGARERIAGFSCALP